MELVRGLEETVERDQTQLLEQVRLAMTEHDYSPEQIAALTKVGASTIRDFLSGVSTPRFDTVAKILYVLDISITLQRETGGAPFVLVRAGEVANASSTSRISSQRDNAATRRVAQAKMGNKQGRKSASKKGVTGWYFHSSSDLREHKRVTPRAA